MTKVIMCYIQLAQVYVAAGQINVQLPYTVSTGCYIIRHPICVWDILPWKGWTTMEVSVSTCIRLALSHIELWNMILFRLLAWLRVMIFTCIPFPIRFANSWMSTIQNYQETVMEKQTYSKSPCTVMVSKCSYRYLQMSSLVYSITHLSNLPVHVHELSKEFLGSTCVLIIHSYRTAGT